MSCKHDAVFNEPRKCGFTGIEAIQNETGVVVVVIIIGVAACIANVVAVNARQLCDADGTWRVVSAGANVNRQLSRHGECTSALVVHLVFRTFTAAEHVSYLVTSVDTVVGVTKRYASSLPSFGVPVLKRVTDAQRCSKCACSLLHICRSVRMIVTVATLQ
jgi:hypothetical protein